MRPITTSVAIGLGLALTACGPTNRSLNSVNQPVVSRSDYIFETRAGPDGLGRGEAERLAGWFDSLHLGYGDHISIDDPAGSGAARDAVARLAAHYGLLLSPSAPSAAGTPEVGALRVIVSRSSAAVPNCPNWEKKSQPEFGASTMSNYGCAVNSNLAAMIAYPEDLIHGREGNAGTDGRVAIRAIQTYRDAPPTSKPGATIGATSTSSTSVRGN